MSQTIRETFSQAVIVALEARGFEPRDIQRLARLDEPQFRAVAGGAAEFTDDPLLSIENFIGMSIGELAVTAIEPNGGPGTELMKSWSGVFLTGQALQKSAARRTVTSPAD